MADETLRAAIIVAMCDLEHPVPTDASAEDRERIELERQRFGTMFTQSTLGQLIAWAINALEDGRVRLVARGQDDGG